MPIYQKTLQIPQIKTNPPLTDLCQRTGETTKNCLTSSQTNQTKKNWKSHDFQHYDKVFLKNQIVK